MSNYQNVSEYSRMVYKSYISVMKAMDTDKSLDYPTQFYEFAYTDLMTRGMTLEMNILLVAYTTYLQLRSN